MITLVGPSAVCFNGLGVYYGSRYTVTTNVPEFDNRRIYTCDVYYLPDVDANNADILRTVTIPFGEARVPNAERALADYIQHADRFDIELLCDGLEQYFWSHNGDMSTIKAYLRNRGLLAELDKWLSMCDI